jgi:PKHD-type hydroxylase
MFKYNVTREFLTKEECNFLVEKLKHNLKLKVAEVKNNEIDTKLRDSSIAFITLNDLPKIKDKLIPFLFDMVKIKGYDLNFDNQPVQFTEYGKDQHYDWHQDIGPDEMSKRKISITVQLSDSDEYEGGDLEIGPYTLGRKLGTGVIFPAEFYHLVTPLTKGIRFSLIGHGWCPINI